MSAIDELLGEIEEKEGIIKENIRNSELQLGVLAVSQHEVLGLHIGSKLLDAALAASAALEEAEHDFDTLEAFLAEHMAMESDLEETLQSIRKLDEETRHLSIRLGAMIYEQCSFSLLDKEAYRVVYDDVETDKKLEADSSASVISRIFGSGKAKVRKIGEEGRFISYADIALKSGSPLDGENASAVLHSLVEKKQQRAVLEDKKTEIQLKIAEDREKARNAENTREQDAERIKGLQKKEEDALVSYGSYLYDKGSEWIDKDTPSEILDALENLLHLHNEEDSVLSEKERLEREAKADDYRAMIESEEGKIMILEKEKERIDREIAEIRKEIEVLRGRIDRLQV